MDPYKSPTADVKQNNDNYKNKPYRFLSIYSYFLSAIHILLIASTYMYEPIEWVGEWMFVDILLFAFIGYRFWAGKNELLVAFAYSSFVLYSEYSESISVIYFSFLVTNIVVFVIAFGYLKFKNTMK